MPVPDQVQDDGSGIQNILKLLDSGVHRNDGRGGFGLFTRLSKLNHKDYEKVKKQVRQYMKGSGDYINLYFDLYWNFKSQIILKDLPPGSKIPTIEELHKRYEVSHGTVRKAM